MLLQRFFKIPLAGCALLLAFAPALAQDAPKLAPATETPAKPALENVSSGKAETVDIVPSNTETAGHYQIDLDSPTHPPINLSPDKSEIIKLDQKATTVISGNPNHLSVLPSNAQELILVGRAPGATYFTALNSKGEVIMQRHVIVAGPKEKYVRIRKSCAATGDKACQATQVYYCPDTCHEIVLNVQESEKSVIPEGATVTIQNPQATPGDAGSQDAVTQ